MSVGFKIQFSFEPNVANLCSVAWVCVRLFVGVLFLLCHSRVSEAKQGVEAKNIELSLLEPTDLNSAQNLCTAPDKKRQFSKKKNGTAKNSENQQEFLCKVTQDELAVIRKEIIDTYKIPGNFSQLFERRAPVGWVDPQKEPLRALSIGTPRKFIRQNQNVIIPVFLLPENYYFHGETETIADLNIAIGYWNEGENDKALRLLDTLVDRVKKFESTDFERSVVYLIRAYLHLDYFAKSIFGMIQTEVPASNWKIRARTDFYKGIGELPIGLLLKKVSLEAESVTLTDLYIKAFEAAVFTDEESEKPIKPPRAVNSKNTTYLDVWLRTIAPTALFNLMALSRVDGQFAKAFTAAEKLGEYAEGMKAKLKDSQAKILSVLSHSPIPSAGKPLYIRPRHLGDLVSLSFLVRASASLKSKDPVQTLIFADETIRSSFSPELAAVGFGIVGNVFYDLRNDVWARRAYAWAQAQAPKMFEVFPDSLLWASEASLWRGNFKRAYAGFKNLRGLLSDRKFGPLIELRLLQLELLSGDETAAAVRTEYIKTHYSGTEIMADIAVMDFCKNGKELTPRVRRLEYEAVLKRIKDSGSELREQAHACLLMADLDQEELTANKAKLQGLEIDLAAKKQVALIETFMKEFPKSPYAQVFQSRLKVLGLSDVFANLSSNNCTAVIDFYLKNAKELWNTSSIQKNAQGLSRPGIDSLVWTSLEMQKTIRCAAFLGENEIWKSLRKGNESDDNEIQGKVLAFKNTRDENDLIALRDSLVQQEGWKAFDSHYEKLDRFNSALLDDELFWRILGVSEILSNEPGLEAKSPFYDKALFTVVNEERASAETQLCVWSEKALSGKFSEAYMQLRLKAVSQSDWLLALPLKDEKTPNKPTTANECFRILAQSIVERAALEPTELTDRLYLWPYVEKMGPLAWQEMALSLARRSFERTKQASEEVVYVFERIAEKSKIPENSAAAKSWLKANQIKEKQSVW